jgi:hypothetical protein
VEKLPVDRWVAMPPWHWKRHKLYEQITKSWEISKSNELRGEEAENKEIFCLKTAL